ncbi:Protein N-acetyltransferase, RimJ/RimL family [Pseudonocardia thermophila]|jgi:Acetyltransferases, including N-acetylases of ribosomal proteins|uniref:Protein N-acetyltransferase, RimJ/RimL family n=1 Tax=Pseudonocardia thermophila TaxID=1848 RepID=A0A1M6ZK36_PSETH|nr:GNAT family N-acetyltransferase [Pseudonocardia thermophila]SHL30891.1 Protein N-acetyltransferase, RimJ/RimL family [Pseudonocardia thermophila]
MPGLPPVLSDGVVTLRAHRADDVPDLVRTAQDPLFRRYTRVPVPYTERHAEDYLDHVRTAMLVGRGVHWAVEARIGGRARFCGSIDVRLNPPPEVGYGLSPWARGRGLMSRALRLAARWAFDELELPILHWSTHAGNLASWRVAHACGFSFHGVRPLSLVHRGELVDGWFGSLRPETPMAPQTPWWEIPVIEGERVRLRPLAESDVPRIAEACADPVTQFWLVALPDPYTEEDARKFVGNTHLNAALGTAVSWAIADREDDRLLANVSVFGLDDVFQPEGGEIGYWAHPDARGRGVVREGAALAVAHAFRPRGEGGLGRERLQLGASVDNAGSRAIAERLGFRFLGVHRRDGYVGRGEARRFDDGAWYELLRTP